MQKILLLLLCGGLMVTSSSCITSLLPVASASTIIMDKRLPGNWSDGNLVYEITPLLNSKFLGLLGPEDKADVTFSLNDDGGDSVFFSKSYGITFKKDGVDYLMGGTMSRINDMYFVDFISLAITDPKRGIDKGSGFEYNYDYQPTFTVAKIEFINDNKMSIKYLNGDYIRQQVTAGNLRLKHEEDKLFNTFLITASSFELQQFLKKYGHDERIYYNKEATVLTRNQ